MQISCLQVGLIAKENLSLSGPLVAIHIGDGRNFRLLEPVRTPLRDPGYRATISEPGLAALG
ncbi:hypothetical protein, partial [Enterococcus faecium]